MCALTVASNTKLPEVAFLVYAPTRQRRADNSFEGNDNIGAKVVEDVLCRAGIRVGRCSPETAKNFRLVLVSFTSTFDVFAFYRAVALIPSWQPKRRAFKVLAGGFGMQNPAPVRHFIDYAAFGRVDNWITGVVDAILGGSEPAHESVMNLPDIHQVKISQPSSLYPYLVSGWSESFTGCPLKCKFCHYTYARKHSGSNEAYGQYVQSGFTGGSSPELTWDGLFTWGKKLGRVRVAIDGFSERLRYVYGKRISNDDIVAGLETVGQYEGITTVLTYNIGNFPGETEEDRHDLYQTLRRVNPKNRVIFVLCTTPFRPSAATPMQWEPVSLFPNWYNERARVIVEENNFRAVHSFTLETSYSHACAVIAERITVNDDELFHAICFAPGLQRDNHDMRLKRLQANFNLTSFLREYDVNEEHPSQFLTSYIERDTMKRIAIKMRTQAAKTKDTRGWLPGRVSMVQGRLGVTVTR